MSSRHFKIIFIVILAITSLLRFINLSYPNKPVFDEAHFATYAIKYAYHLPHIDIHPPLGKVLYALPILLSPADLKDVAFIERFTNDSGGISSRAVATNSFPQIPYVLMRGINALFSVSLGVALFLFLKELTNNRVIALIALALYAFENYLILEGRLILLNEIYLALGFFSLFLFFKKKSRPVLAGIIWGLSLGTKLIAVVFIGPVIAKLILQRNKQTWAEIKKFILAGFIGLSLILFFVNNLMIPPNEQINFLKQYFKDEPATATAPNYVDFIKSHPRLYAALEWITVPVSNAAISIYGYTYQQNAAPPYGPPPSQWYQWPLMKGLIYYYTEPSSQTARSLVSLGNPIIWLGVLLAVIFTMVKFCRDVFKKHLPTIGDQKQEQYVLLLSYAFALIPFTLVHRTTYLYHYFPALLFGIGLLSNLLYIKYQSFSSRSKIIFRILSCILAGTGFIIIAPYTYGFHWTLSENLLRLLKLSI